MEHYPVLVGRRGLGDQAWAMVLRIDNLVDFARFIPGFSRTEHTDANPAFVSHDAKHTAKPGDVILLDKATHEVVGVCNGAYFNSHWALVRDLNNKMIPMPVFDADEPIKTNEVEIHDVIVNAIRGEFHDFEDRFETALATKQDVGENSVTDEVGTELRKWVLLWVERNMRDKTVFEKLKAANMLSKFVTSGNYDKYWMAG